MATEEGRPVVDLIDETRLNVASLLQEPVGETRLVTLALASLPLDDGLTAEDIRATARLTRIKDAILVSADIAATVPLECATCLAAYNQPIAERFSEPFRQLVDVRSGAAIPPTINEDGEELGGEPGFLIDESHELDLTEAIRQWIVLTIPMQPSCGPDCPGPLLRSTEPDNAIDSRFAGLASLLDDDDTETGND